MHLMPIKLVLHLPCAQVSEFRMNPTYSIYFNWFRFITIGIVPFCLLVFFNTQIYLDIRYLLPDTVFFAKYSQCTSTILTQSNTKYMYLSTAKKVRYSQKSVLLFFLLPGVAECVSVRRPNRP